MAEAVQLDLDQRTFQNVRLPPTDSLFRQQKSRFEMFIGLNNKTYEEVDRHLRRLTGIPENLEWSSLKERAFRGIVPQKNTNAFYKIVQDNWKLNNKEYTEQSVHKHFRIDPCLANFFITTEPIYTYTTKTKRIFVTGALDAEQHSNHKDLFKQLTTIMDVASANLYSIQKDTHDGSTTRTTPFMHPYVAMLVIDLH